MPAVLPHMADGVGNHGAGGGKVVRQLGRAHKRHICAVLPGDLCDFVIIGGHDNLFKAACTSGGENAVGNHGFAVERTDVFTRNAFAAAACGDDTQGHKGFGGGQKKRR